MVRKIFFRHQKSLRHLAMTLTKYSISAHLGAPRRGLRGDVMVTCHGTKTRHGNTAKSHTNVMVFPYRRERRARRPSFVHFRLPSNHPHEPDFWGVWGESEFTVYFVLNLIGLQNLFWGEERSCLCCVLQGFKKRGIEIKLLPAKIIPALVLLFWRFNKGPTRWLCSRSH